MDDERVRSPCVVGAQYLRDRRRVEVRFAPTNDEDGVPLPSDSLILLAVIASAPDSSEYHFTVTSNDRRLHCDEVRKAIAAAYRTAFPKEFYGVDNFLFRVNESLVL